MKESFVFYRSFIDAIRTLPDEDQLKLFHAISDFALDQNEPSFDGTLNGFWMLIKPNIDANNKRYENGKKGGVYGIMGGRPRKQETPTKPQQNPNKTPSEKKITPDVDVDVDVDVNVNEEKKGKKKNPRFSPPSLFEIQNYFTQLANERGLKINTAQEAEKYESFYTSKGWYVGKNKMVDWRAAVRNWLKNVKPTNGHSFEPLTREKSLM